MLGPKKIYPVYFGKKMGQQKSQVQTNFCSKDSRWKQDFESKISKSKKILGEKMLGQNFGPKSFESQKIWAEKILSPKKLGQKKFWQTRE